MSESDDWEKEVDDIVEKKPEPKKAADEDSDDDWEKEVDDVLEEKKEESKAKGKFDDEDNVDSDDERKKKAEDAKKKAAAAGPARVKAKTQKDYDKLFDERQKKKPGANKNAAEALASGKKGEALSKAAEEDITEQLFAADLGTESSNLKSVKNYENFAKQVSDVLYEGQGPHNLPAFFTELFKGLSTSGLTSIDIKSVLDSATVVYNAKVAEEKKQYGGGSKKGKQKPKISAGKQTVNARNNNPQMVNELMGNDEDEYGAEYGAEAATGNTREAEASYDFM